MFADSLSTVVRALAVHGTHNVPDAVRVPDNCSRLPNFCPPPRPAGRRGHPAGSAHRLAACSLCRNLISCGNVCGAEPLIER